MSRRERRLARRLRQRADDAVMPDPRPTDIIIPVMGPTGAGKSTFINNAIGWEEMAVGHQLMSCTQRLQHIILPGTESDPSRRIILLDTPGFDDTYIDDVEILRRISVWLSQSYNKDMKLAGLIYLHDISQTRVFGSTRKNLEMFRVICGEDALKCVTLVSTKWALARAEGDRREEQLKENFWGGMLALGAKTMRVENDSNSALAVVNKVVEGRLARIDHVQLQNEIVTLGRLLPQTDAGRTLAHVLKDAAARQKLLEERMRPHTQGSQDGTVPNPALQKEYEENRERLKSTLDQIKQLEISIPQRVLLFVGLDID